MEVLEFTIIASGLDPNEDGFEDRFFEAGCNDATMSWQKGAIILDFTREAEDFHSAVQSAIDDVRAAGARVERIEPDYLVSLSDVAKRTGLTRAAISHYAAGDRSSGFPAPVSRVTTQNPLWDWAMVAGWLYKAGRVESDVVLRAREVREINVSLTSTRLRECEAAYTPESVA